MSRMCHHKTSDDFSRVVDGVRIWTCSACGKESAWTDGHGYVGTLECKRCWRAEIESVYCSAVCAGDRLPAPAARVRGSRKQSATRVNTGRERDMRAADRLSDDDLRSILATRNQKSED